MPDLQYTTGTVSVDADGTTVTGSGVIWSSPNAKAYDWIAIDGADPVPVTAVTDVGHLEVPAWQGGAKSGVPYVIYQVSPLRFTGADAMASVERLVSALVKEGFFWFVGPDETEPDPSYGVVGQYARQPSTGKEWLMTATGWSYQGIFGGLNFDPEPWGSGTTYARNAVRLRAGKLWISLQGNNLNHPPESSALWWGEFLSGGDVYDVGGYSPDRPGSGENIMSWLMPRTVTFPVNLTGSVAKAGTGATADARFSIRKNGSEWASVTVAAGQTSGAFSAAAETVFATGDVLDVIGPSPRDATLADMHVTLIGYR